jgi:hypothetical protein
MGKAKLVAINKRGRRIGSTHQRAKHADAALERIKQLKAEGLGYRRIAARLKDEGTPIPWTTVRDVIKGHIRNQQPAEWRRHGQAKAAVDPRRPLSFDVPDFRWMPMPGGDSQAQEQWDKNNAEYEEK